VPLPAPRSVRTAVTALFVVSGASGLVFELLWVRQLGLLVGHTALAVSLVVAAFLAGLVLGSLLLGRLADQVRRPLLSYGLLEVLTGLSALGVSALLPALPGLLERLGCPGGGPLGLRALVAFGVVLPPTFLMGGTLPVLVRFAARELGTLGRSFAGLYALNTLGAAAGCGLAGFVLLGGLGLSGTALAAAMTNLGVGCLAWLLHGLAHPAPVEIAPPPPDADTTAALGGLRRILLVAGFAVCGFVSIGYEGLWFRVLSTYLDSTAYAFSVLLTTFLLGLVLGGLVYTRWPGPGGLAGLARVETWLALAGLLSLVLLALAPRLRVELGAWLAGPRAGVVAMLLVSALVLLAPATLIGLVFPQVVQLTARHLSRAASQVGLLYSLNTLGGIVGSLAVGFALVPGLGTQGTYALLVGASMALALLFQALDPGRTPWPRRLGTWATAALLGLVLALLPGDLLWAGLTVRPDARLAFLRDGIDGPLAVLEYDAASTCDSGLYACGPGCRARSFRHQQLVFGSVSYANTVLPRKRYMAALAHLPMLAHPAPREALLVCFGTGSTAGAFLSHPELTRLTLVDSNPDVFAAAPLFAEHNHGALQDPRVEVVVDDGRHFLLADPREFDVISFEPPPPTAAGVVNLYSVEFYRLVRARLRAGGILAQWIPLDQPPDVLARGLVRSLQEVFPEVSLWIPSDHEAVLLASEQPLDLGLERWQGRASEPGVAAALAEVGFGSPEAVLATFVAGPAALERWSEGARAITDDWPGVEYFLSVDPAPFAPEALLALAHPPPVIGAGPWQLEHLARELGAARHALGSTALKRQGRFDEAHARVRDARALVGPNAYLDFLLEIELGCLRPAGG
jgi:spermidine synthase